MNNMLEDIKITEIVAVPLFGESPKGDGPMKSNQKIRSTPLLRCTLMLASRGTAAYSLMVA